MAGGPNPGCVPTNSRFIHFGYNPHWLKQPNTTKFLWTCLKSRDTIASHPGELAQGPENTHNILFGHHKERQELLRLCTSGTDDTAHNLFRCPARAGCDNCKIGSKLGIISQRALEEQQEIRDLLQFIPETKTSPGYYQSKLPLKPDYGSKTVTTKMKQMMPISGCLRLWKALKRTQKPFKTASWTYLTEASSFL